MYLLVTAVNRIWHYVDPTSAGPDKVLGTHKCMKLYTGGGVLDAQTHLIAIFGSDYFEM